MNTIILPHSEAVKFNPGEGYNVMIRVIETDSDFLKLRHKKKFKDILELKFDDVSEKCYYTAVGEFGEEKEKTEYPISKSQARKVVHFFQKNESCDNMIIHCYAGWCRSPAIAYCWYMFKGEKDKANALYHSHNPNQTVVTTIMKEMEDDVELLRRLQTL